MARAPVVKEATLNSVAGERVLLGCLLRSPHEFWQITEIVQTDYFSVPIHRDIYREIKDFCERGLVPSITALSTKLPPDDEEGSPIEGVLSALIRNAEDAGSARDYANDIAEMAARRRLVQIANEIGKSARNAEKPAMDVAGEAELQLLEIMRVTSPSKPRKLPEISEEVLKLVGQAQASGSSIGYTTGLESLDKILGPIMPGDLGFILASQADGKTSLAVQIGIHVAKTAKKPVLFLELEMSDQQIATRELAAESGVPMWRIDSGQLNEVDFNRLRDAGESFKDTEFWIVDAAEMTVRQMRSMALGLQRTAGLAMLMIDQFDKIKSNGRHKDRFEKYMEVTRDLKILAKDLKVPVITLAQRTRGAQRRDDPTPDVLDADAPSAERDCDFVLGIWREYNWLQRHRPGTGAYQEDLDNWELKRRNSENKAEAICLKRRRGKPFEQCVLGWDGARTRFVERG